MTKFIRENVTGLEQSLQAEAEEIAHEAEAHLSAALATKERWMASTSLFPNY